MSDGRFETVAIVGVGLLGASLGLALKRRGLAARIVGVGRAESESIKVALSMGAIDAGMGDVAEGVQGADLVVLCTPVRTFPAMMARMLPHLKKDVVVTDVGSVKGVVMQWAKEKLPGVSFVGSHPMAGSEKSGPGAARENLYDGAVCLMCVNEAAAAAGDRVAAMWHGVGMGITFLSPQDHDAWVATISHLPHAVAGCLVQATAAVPESTKAAAGGFMDSTRIAGGDVAMWTDIFLTNRRALVEAMGVFQEEMVRLKAALLAGDEDAIRKHLTAAKERRAQIIDARANRGKT